MLAPLVARLRSLAQHIFGRQRADGEMSEEFRLHMELRAETLMRGGAAPPEAMRQARREFGLVERHKEAARASRGLKRFDVMRLSWLDFRLGARMLVKYPGLTLVGGLAFAFAIAIGAVAFELITRVVRPELPLADGVRIVGFRVWDIRTSRVERSVLHDFTRWQSQLQTVQNLGAFRMAQRNLITNDGLASPVEVVEISAAAFKVAGVSPYLGRPLEAADESPNAPAVAVIGYETWQSRFGGARAVIGRTVRLGHDVRTIVGVMPQQFAFPVSNNFWVPSRVNALLAKPREGAGLSVFGRLAPGATMAAAQAELNNATARASREFPATHAYLRAEVMPYARSILNVSTIASAGLWSINVFLVMLLVLICANVATLVFARTATRETEIVVRNALGASRARIIMQLFAEALVLGGVAMVVGLGAAAVALRWVVRTLEHEAIGIVPGTHSVNARLHNLPFWFTSDIGAPTVLYAVCLTMLGAFIVGVVPALKVTRGIGSRLRYQSGTSVRLGGVWTAAIVAQVAVTVAFPATSFFARRDAIQIRDVHFGFPAQDYLAMRVQFDASAPLAAADTSGAAKAFQRGVVLERFAERLRSEPGVTGVTFANLLPRMDHPQRIIEVEGIATQFQPGQSNGAREPNTEMRASSVNVAPNYFDVLNATAIAGRNFAFDDATSGRRVVMVNRSFVNTVLGGRNAIGQLVRYRNRENAERDDAPVAPGPWYEIVGVMPDLAMTDGSDPQESGAGLYHPALAEGLAPLQLLVKMRGETQAFLRNVPSIAATVDAALQVPEVFPLVSVQDSNFAFAQFWYRMLAFVSAASIFVSLAGIYSVMSFTVARRTREIGIRVALGADKRRLVSAVFARPVQHIALGVFAGGVIVAVLVLGIIGALAPTELALVLMYALIMMLVCLLACVVPTWRAFRIQPTEALRADG